MANDGIFTQLVEATRNEAVTVGTSSSVVANARNANKPRTSIMLRNISADPTSVITVNFNFGTATANTGIVLNQYESVTDSSESGYSCFQGMITAICNNAGATLAIYER